MEDVLQPPVLRERKDDSDASRRPVIAAEMKSRDHFIPDL
jgi:hypothetical protein